MYWCKYHIYQNFLNVQKIKKWIPCHCLCQRNLNNIYMLLFNLKRPLSKTIFMKHHVICSLISSCCNHLSSSMLTNVKLVIQLKLNDMGYKFVFHSYSKFASNTWYHIGMWVWKMVTKPQKNYMGMNIYHLLDFFKKKILEKNSK
jgi:hypothetical protein